MTSADRVTSGAAYGFHSQAPQGAYMVRPLSSLPNREGFKFRGIRKDGGRYMNCRLKRLPGGMYVAAAGRYVYDDVAPELLGWMPHPSRSQR